VNPRQRGASTRRWIGGRTWPPSFNRARRVNARADPRRDGRLRAIGDVSSAASLRSRNRCVLSLLRFKGEGCRPILREREGEISRSRGPSLYILAARDVSVAIRRYFIFSRLSSLLLCESRVETRLGVTAQRGFAAAGVPI